MRVTSISVVVGFAALAGCATTAGYQKMLVPWTGRDEISLVRKWGAPVRSYSVANSRFLVFESRKEVVQPDSPGIFDTSTKGNKTSAVFMPGSSGGVLVYTCTTTFELRAGQVVGASFAGNGCRAME